jgi:DNA adenine methylase
MTQLAKVSTAKPPAPYIGGKRNLASTLIKRINAVPHKTYVEPFCGMGGVFFRRDHRPPCEVINDYNGEVTNLFRILQRHYSPFMGMMRFMLTNRQDFTYLEITERTLTYSH